VSKAFDYLPFLKLVLKIRLEREIWENPTGDADFQNEKRLCEARVENGFAKTYTTVL